MDDRALLQRRTEGSMQAVFEIKLSLPFDDVGEQVAVERRVVSQQGFQVEGPLGGDQFVQADLSRREFGPVTQLGAMFGIRPAVSHPLENHPGQSR